MIFDRDTPAAKSNNPGDQRTIIGRQPKPLHSVNGTTRPGLARAEPCHVHGDRSKNTRLTLKIYSLPGSVMHKFPFL